jgi:conjugal transfer pilus assembly protein TraB
LMNVTDLKERWTKATPAVRFITIAVIALIALVTFLVLKPASGTSNRKKVDVNQQPAKADLLLPKPQDRTVEQLSGEVTAVRNQAAKLESKLIESNENVRVLLGKLEALAKDQTLTSGLGDVRGELVEQMKELSNRLSAVERSTSDVSPPDAPPAPGVRPAINSSSTIAPRRTQPEQSTPAPAKTIVIAGAKPPSTEAAPASKPEEIPYLTAGSMFEAVMLNGMDAPTDQSASQAPVPAVLRVKSLASLPNLLNVPEVTECRVSVAGFGELKDERAKMRTEMLACVIPSSDPDGKPRIVERKIEGYVVGEDGRVGVRGRLVSKQGQVIARSMIAGAFSGFAQALQPRSIQGLDINPGNQVQTQRYDPSIWAQSGLAQGVSDASKTVSQLYMKMVDQMMPVLEIDAGRKVTVVLLKGVELK